MLSEIRIALDGHACAGRARLQAGAGTAYDRASAGQAVQQVRGGGGAWGGISKIPVERRTMRCRLWGLQVRPALRLITSAGAVIMRGLRAHGALEFKSQIAWNPFTPALMSHPHCCRRASLFPIQHDVVWLFYKQAEASFWTGRWEGGGGVLTLHTAHMHKHGWEDAAI